MAKMLPGKIGYLAHRPELQQGCTEWWYACERSGRLGAIRLVAMRLVAFVFVAFGFVAFSFDAVSSEANSFVIIRIVASSLGGIILVLVYLVVVRLERASPSQAAKITIMTLI